MTSIELIMIICGQGHPHLGDPLDELDERALDDELEGQRCIYLYLSFSIHMYVLYTFIYIYIYICVICTCMYTYIYIYIHI